MLLEPRAQARRGGPDVDSGAGFREFVENNVKAEALGYASSFVVEHHFTGFGQISATLNLLTWVGARTKTLRLGTAVITLPWHNPVLLAEQVATMDLLSGGRIDFGIGQGYRHNEFAGFCIPMEEADQRFDECLEVMLKAWTSDRPWSHRGKYFQFDNVEVTTKPVMKGLTIYCNGQKIGITGTKIFIYEGPHHLELLDDRLNQPVPFDVNVTVPRKDYVNRPQAIDLTDAVRR